MALSAYATTPRELAERPRFWRASERTQRAILLLHLLVDSRGYHACDEDSLRIALRAFSYDVVALVDEALALSLIEVFEEAGDLVLYLVGYREHLTKRMEDRGRRNACPDRTDASIAVTSLSRHLGRLQSADAPTSVRGESAELPTSVREPADFSPQNGANESAVSPQSRRLQSASCARPRAAATSLSLSREEPKATPSADAPVHTRERDTLYERDFEAVPETQESPAASQGDPLGSREQPRTESAREAPKVPAYQKRHEPPRGMSGMPRSQTAHFDRFADHFGDPLPPLPPPKPEPTDEELMALWHAKRAAYEAERAREQGPDDEAAAPAQEAP